MKHVWLFMACICANSDRKGIWAFLMFLALEAYFIIDKYNPQKEME